MPIEEFNTDGVYLDDYLVGQVEGVYFARVGQARSTLLISDRPYTVKQFRLDFPDALESRVELVASDDFTELLPANPYEA